MEMTFVSISQGVPGGQMFGKIGFVPCEGAGISCGVKVSELRCTSSDHPA